MNKYRKFLLLIFSSFILSGVFTSCADDDDPVAIISVVKLDSNGKEWAVSNAEVRFVVPEGTSLPQLLEFAEKPKFTDIAGEVTYTVKHEGIVKVKATHGTGAESCGQGVIIFSKNEIFREKIRLSACYED